MVVAPFSRARWRSQSPHRLGPPPSPETLDACFDGRDGQSTDIMLDCLEQADAGTLAGGTVAMSRIAEPRARVLALESYAEGS
jgi:hypothetical protein